MKKQSLYSVHFAFANRHYVLNGKTKQLDLWKSFAQFYLDNPECPPMKFIVWKEEARLSQYDGQPIVYDVVTSTKAHMRKLMRLMDIKRSQKNDSDLNDFTLEWQDSWNEPKLQPWKENLKKMESLKQERSREPESEEDTSIPLISIARPGFPIKQKADEIIDLVRTSDKLLTKTEIFKMLKGSGNTRARAMDMVLTDPRISIVKYGRAKALRFKAPDLSLSFKLGQELFPENSHDHKAPYGIDLPEEDNSIYKEIIESPKTEQGLLSPIQRTNLEPEYVKPSPQRALGGNLGLTSDDIAKSLGVTVSNVNQKCSRIDLVEWQKDGYQLIADAINSSTPGRPGMNYIFALDAAKYFIGNWNNKIGRGYFRYLLECEKIVESQPKQISFEERIAQAIQAGLSAATANTERLVNPVKAQVAELKQEMVKTIERTDVYLKGLINVMEAATGPLPDNLCHFEEAIKLSGLPGIGREPAKHLIKAGIESMGGTLYTYPRRAKSVLIEDDGKVVYPQFPERTQCAAAGMKVRQATELVKVTKKRIYLKCDLWRDDVEFILNRDEYENNSVVRNAWRHVVGEL